MTVLELASVLAGPSVGQFFAELGAEVIKVENPVTGGDVTRSWKAPGENTDDCSAYFSSANWGKKSIAIDLSSTKGREIVLQLAAQSQIVLVSYKPGDARRLGVDYESLIGHNPTLIYGEITGYGPSNPRVGYDAIIQAEAGFMSMNGEPGGRSLKMPVALMDILAAHHLKEGLLLALLERTSTGKGKHVSVSLIQAAIASLANQASNWLVGGVVPAKQGSAHPNIAPYGEIYLTKDQREIMIASGTDQQFRALCAVLNLHALVNDARFLNNTLRVKNRADLSAILTKAIGSENADDVFNRLRQARVPAGIVKDVREAIGSAEAHPLKMTAGELSGLRTFASNPDTSTHLAPPPHLGQDTREILLNRLGYSPENVDLLYHEGIIA